MKFIWYVTELNNRKHWGGTFVGYNQGEALTNLGHTVAFADPVSDFSYLATHISPDWVYIPVEFIRYPFFENILYYKKKMQFKLVVGVGIFRKWVKKIDCGDLYITQWYGPGIDSFPLDLHYIPHGFNSRLHTSVKQEIKYETVFVGRNQPATRNPEKYLYKLKKVNYFGYGWPGTVETVENEDVAKLYNQALVCPNFHGVNQKGDFRMLNERAYQICACGGFQVCDYIPGMEQFFPEDCLLTAKTPGEWVEKINHYIKNPKEREPYITRGIEAVQQYSYKKIMTQFLELL
jgi:hypothetical protein